MRFAPLAGYLHLPVTLGISLPLDRVAGVVTALAAYAFDIMRRSPTGLVHGQTTSPTQGVGTLAQAVPDRDAFVENETQPTP